MTGDDLRLARHGAPGAERPGLVDGAGVLRDLSYVLIDISARALEPDDVDILRSIEPETLPPLPGAPPLALPVMDLAAVRIDGAPAETCALLGPAARPAYTDGAMLALAALVGAPGFVAGYMAATVSADRRQARLGPWLVAPARPLRPDRLAAGGRPVGLRRRDALTPPADAAAGDILIAVADAPAGLAGPIDGFGPRR